MQKNKRLIGVYDYTVLLTYIGLTTSMLGIFVAINGNIFISLICLMVSGLCDTFDGPVARSKKIRSEIGVEFGKQIDSLSDLVCFGVLPSVILSTYAKYSLISVIASCALVLCGLIRLAYYNITCGSSKYFTGLPITSTALIFPLMFIITKLFVIEDISFIIFISLLNALCFILPFNIKKPTLKIKIIIALIGLAELITLISIK